MFLKIKRGGEYFWTRLIKQNADGSKFVRCENETFAPLSPAYRTEFTIPANEQIFDVMNPDMRDHIKVVA